MLQSPHPLADAVVAICGVIYFTAWSLSFYPQLILNYRRKTTTGLSPDFIYLNPIGFLALTIWSWGAYFSPLARTQYAARHNGHAPQIAVADLAFSLHALVISSVTLLQVFYYAYRNRNHTEIDNVSERTRLIPLPHELQGTSKSTAPSSSTRPSIPFQIAITGIVVAGIISGASVWAGRTEWLDWLYFASSVKLFVTLVKYIPQVILNTHLRSVEGFAIENILLDLTGSIFSFAQLVIASVFIEHDPSGIVANPAKLGLSLIALSFDLVFIVQNYWLYPGKRIEGVV
ncbi:hypothetical protein JCM24511_01804 [Saitozyma sp. JCM 24511]|nr:hypothetical protein JCM24511_01804 [Saitozyma sp. JCM 24511]